MRKILLAGAAATVFASAAMAAVTFDQASGTGFVGKGDVQTLFGYNNATMQSKAESTTFSYQSLDVYSAVCTWITGEGTRGEKTHNVPHARRTAVNAAIASDPRKTGQWTGWNLNGWGAITEIGAKPVVNEACLGNEGHNGTWSSVDLISSSGGLYATIDNASRLLQ